MKVISQPNPEFGHSSENPLSVLGQALFPPGNTNAPMEQLQQFYHLGVQAMNKSGGDTRANSASVATGITLNHDHNDDDDRHTKSFKLVLSNECINLTR